MKPASDAMGSAAEMPKREIDPSSAGVLRRELGLSGAVLTGMGSILGTGVFVSIGIGAGITGPSVLLAIAVAAAVATCNALSSAQLAATLPVSGGTYEYGYHYLRPWLGFLAGWLFLCAKTASAATAARGFAGYLTTSVELPAIWSAERVAVLAVIALTAIVAAGVRRSNWANWVIVATTLAALGGFVLCGISLAVERGAEHLSPLIPPSIGGFLEASALMFVAYTGYGRIATMGEEVREPRQTIPRAIVITLVLSALIYLAVGLIGTAAVGATAFSAATAERTAPLVTIAAAFDQPWLVPLVSIGAMTAMLGVSLNLQLGLSRVLLAMGRRGDAPRILAKLNTAQTTPAIAVLTVGVAIVAFCLIGDFKTTWSFSAFTVLIYYAITNLAALAMPAEQRLYPRWIACAGLASCLGLAFWVEPRVWAAGLVIIAAGLVGRWVFRRALAG
jgi:APA family basic amino acid/polyamine antiporter